MVVEIWAAVAGASVGIAASGIKSAGRESQQGRDSLVRLTSAVDNLSSQLDLLRREQTTSMLSCSEGLAMLSAASPGLKAYKTGTRLSAHTVPSWCYC